MEDPVEDNDHVEVEFMVDNVVEENVNTNEQNDVSSM